MSCDHEPQEKQPWEVIDIDVTFDRFFRDIETDYITLAEISITGSDSSLVGGGGGHGSVELLGSPPQAVRVWLSGGTEGLTYKISLRVTTNDGRKEETDFYVTMVD